MRRIASTASPTWRSQLVASTSCVNSVSTFPRILYPHRVHVSARVNLHVMHRVQKPLYSNAIGRCARCSVCHSVTATQCLRADADGTFYNNLNYIPRDNPLRLCSCVATARSCNSYMYSPQYASLRSRADCVCIVLSFTAGHVRLFLRANSAHHPHPPMFPSVHQCSPVFTTACIYTHNENHFWLKKAL